jgi:predicted nucleotidyltransferase
MDSFLFQLSSRKDDEEQILFRRYEIPNSENFYQEFSELCDEKSVHEYSPDEHLEDKEWYAKQDFRAKIGGHEFENFMKFHQSIVNFDKLERDEFSRVEWSCCEVCGKLYFQRFQKSSVIEKTGFFAVRGDFEFLRDVKVLVINPIPDAIYDPKKDILYFKKLDVVTGIFKDARKICEKASEKQVKDFLDDSLFAVDKGFNKDKISLINLRKIRTALKQLASFRKAGREGELLHYFRTYRPELVSGNTLKIGSQSNLRDVLYGIDERFYTTELNKTKRMASAVRKL